MNVAQLASHPDCCKHVVKLCWILSDASRKMGIAPVEDVLLVYLHCFKGQVAPAYQVRKFLKKSMSPLFRLRIAPARSNKRHKKSAAFRAGTLGGCLHEWKKPPLMSIFSSNKWHFKTTYNLHAHIVTCSAFWCVFLFFFVCVFFFGGGLFVEFPWYYSSLMIWEFHGIFKSRMKPLDVGFVEPE